MHSRSSAYACGGRDQRQRGLRVVPESLSHADIKTTFGYACLAESSVFDAANRVSRRLADMFNGPSHGTTSRRGYA